MLSKLMNLFNSISDLFLGFNHEMVTTTDLACSKQECRLFPGEYKAGKWLPGY